MTRCKIPMLKKIEEAWKIIASNLPASIVELSPVLSNQLGLVLGEDVFADLNMPPFIRSQMDGFAIRLDPTMPNVPLRITGAAEAGAPPSGNLAPGEAWHISTGAPVPRFTDLVLPIELARLNDDCTQVSALLELSLGKNLLEMGEEFKMGDLLLPKSTVLGPAEYGILAQAGKTSALLHQSPRAAIVSTGNELEEPNLMPGPGHIRNSNGPMLMSQAVRAGCLPRFLGIARDTPEATEKLLKEGLDHQILIISGGVSVGPKDLVRMTLEKLGIDILVHGISLKPGKPFLFGTNRYGRVVFGLPGNPVSSFVTFELLVRPALERIRGLCSTTIIPLPAQLSESWVVTSDRPLRQPARLNAAPTGWRVSPQKWRGSPDLRSLLGANALVCLEPGKHNLRAGDSVGVIPLS